MNTRFAHPPINELVIGAYFEPPLSMLRNQYIGLFWSEIRNEFPKIEQQLPIGSSVAFEAADAEEIFPMPRFWFISPNQDTLIQVQKDAFLFNWRRRESEYPHYKENLKPAFDRYYQTFESFALSELDVHELKVSMCELTYINMIDRCDYWQGPQDTAKVIPSFKVPNRKNSPLRRLAFNCTYWYIISSDLQLQVTIRNANSAKNVKLPVLIFEIKATGRLDRVISSCDESWYDRAHDAIISLFLNLTSKDIQRRYWKRTGEA